MRIFRAIAAAGLAVSALAMGASGSAAAEYPERNVTMYVAYSPGGGTDVMARTLHAPLDRAALGVVRSGTRHTSMISDTRSSSESCVECHTSSRKKSTSPGSR